jgi:hypothetical protein
MLSRTGGNHGHKIIPSVSRANLKWLNVVLDLHGLLCVCREKWLIPRGQVYVDGSRPHSASVPYLIGSKAVYIRLSCERFFRELGNVANITIWSSMRVTTAKSICDLLFKNVLLKLVNILGQDSYDGIRVQNSHRKVSYMKVKGTDKQLFLKSIEKQLFLRFNGRYLPENIVVVDDSPVKHVLNPIENVILLESWSFEGEGQSDTYLIDTLLPWILQLHQNQEQGIGNFQKVNKIGRPMMCEDPFDPNFGELNKTIEEDAKL